MPLYFREGSDDIGYASYRFPDGSSIDSEAFPWIRTLDPKNQAVSEERLCVNCRQLDFRFLFSHLLSETRVRAPNGDQNLKVTLFDGIHLGNICDIRKRSGCSFCSLVIAALDEGHPNGNTPAEYSGPTGECTLRNKVRGLHATSLFQIHAAEDEFPGVIQLGFRVYPPGLTEPRIIQLIADEHGEPGKLCPGKRVSRMVDFSQIAKWLASCENTTRLEATEERRSGVSTHLIDVNRNCLIGPVCNAPYVALSYVWGNTAQLMLTMDSLAILQQENSLSLNDNRIPRTIRDAMVLCKQLQRPYIWVDSLCIIQDSPTKIELINRMNDVYRNAEFTIVAAEGSNANAGLPGLSTTDRTLKQRTAVVNGLTLANAMTKFDVVVNSSTWNSRGWTFQERILSRRKLIFTGEQLFFECDHGEMSENFYVDIHDYELKNKNPLKEDSQYSIDILGKANFDTYGRIVRAYTKRNLGYPQDIIAALAGVSNEMFKPLFNNHPLLHGVPLPILDIGLLWHPDSALQRRQDTLTVQAKTDTSFASWSWAGWIGETYYPSITNLSEATASRVEWLNSSKLRESGMLEAIPPEFTSKPPAEWPHWSQWNRVVSEDGSIYYVDENDSSETWYCRPIPPPAHPIVVPMDRDTRHLHFIGETASLTVNGEHSQSLYADPRCQEGNHQVCQLNVFDRDGYQAGVVVVDGNTSAQLTPGLHSFIKLSQTTLSPGMDDPAWDAATESFSGVPGAPGLTPFVQYGPSEELFDPEKYSCDVCWCLYNVLLVDWKDGVAYRVGVGKIHIHAFNQADPQKRRIELG